MIQRVFAQYTRQPVWRRPPGSSCKYSPLIQVRRLLSGLLSTAECAVVEHVTAEFVTAECKLLTMLSKAARRESGCNLRHHFGAGDMINAQSNTPNLIRPI